MATKTVAGKNNHYGDIQRGCSFMIPVVVKTDHDEPLDLTGHRAAFTVKKVQYDFDRHDDFAYIRKDIIIQFPQDGSFYIMLTSDDTDFEPGQFYFDIELTNEENGMVWRLCTLTFNLVGGPTNRLVNKGIGQLPTGDTITTITLTEGGQIIVIAPTLNLDGDFYSQFATLMEQVDTYRTALETVENIVSSQSQVIEDLRRDVDDLKAQIGV